MPPIRSPRRLYLISTITVPIDDNPDAIDPVAGGTTRPIIAKIKEAVGEYLELTPLTYNNPIFTGTFGGNGTNKDAKFRKNLGGYRDASYTLVANNQFSIREFVRNQTTGDVTRVTNDFKTITIGFPKGHSVTEVLKWLESTPKLSQIRAVISPAGHRTDLYTAS